MNVGINNKATAINQMFVGVDGVAKLVYSSGGGSSDFQLPTFTGSNSVFGDEISGRIEMYESGTLVLFPGNYDVFTVGGGSSCNGLADRAAGGGAGGYTSTRTSYKVTARTEHNVEIGAGGAGGGKAVSGGGTSVTVNSNRICDSDGGTILYTPASASGHNGACGFNGGSGGGAGRFPKGNSAGGSDGSGGGSSMVAGSSGDQAFGGTGQGTTTRAFGESDGTLYAGGGGGAGRNLGSTEDPGSGGAGGGGQGAFGETGNQGTPGTPNTGGGGGGTNRRSDSAGGNVTAGGSGIAIVRWNNAAPTLLDNFE